MVKLNNIIFKRYWMILATSYKVVNGRIQLYDKNGEMIPDGTRTRWEGNFYCYNNQLTSLVGSPSVVGGNFDCSYNQLTSLVGSPSEVAGYFYCHNNQLTSLEGSPIVVGGGFYCYNNQLTSLVGSPSVIGGSFYCSNNNLKSLEGSPSVVAGNFDCSNNQLQSLEGSPTVVAGNFNCSDNQLQSLVGSPTEVGGNFNCSDNQLQSLVGSPTEVGGGFYCYNNQLKSLEGSPTEVGGDFDCSDNQLKSLVGSPTEVEGNFYCSNNPTKETYQGTQYSFASDNPVPDYIQAILYTKGYLLADGILSHIVKERNNVFTIRHIGSDKVSYCVYKDGNFSHGVTIKEAIESLRYKLATRNVEDFKQWKLNEKKSLEELIVAYRSITGACSEGVRNFCNKIELEKIQTIQDVINVSKGHYGSEKFASFWR